MERESIIDKPVRSRSRWGAPAFAIFTGWASLPMLFVSPMSALLGIMLVLTAFFVASVVIAGEFNTLQKLTAVVGASGGIGSMMLLVLPFLRQN